MPLFTAALVAAGAMVGLRCLSAAEALRSVEIRVLLTIAASFAVGEALEKTGVARVLGHGLMETAQGLGPVGILAAVYLATMLLTEMITNNAAAALMFPIAAAAAGDAGMELRPFLFVLMMAASASFATPIGYQTNLMVFGAGRLPLRRLPALRDPAAARGGRGQRRRDQPRLAVRQRPRPTRAAAFASLRAR